MISTGVGKFLKILGVICIGLGVVFALIDLAEFIRLLISGAVGSFLVSRELLLLLGVSILGGVLLGIGCIVDYTYNTFQQTQAMHDEMIRMLHSDPQEKPVQYAVPVNPLKNAEIKRCPMCSKEIKNNALFCPRCGTKL